ncbi:helix-turn-helix transcriptional regulator [Actinacidiphila epipremni]|uniref:YafY family transcriptional regulator n=1 Tax=Actinacidiphila epipremni TaxID=2053013 RepID=A0ABX1A122_9ACTN|nr:YafY family protein [Actinacidiphila epipremni]NJP47476.1 YafY family transcriptional regulator [Actinacidiphila epipremni]
MLETSARLLRMLSLLQSRRDWGGPELAQRLDVTARTVRRDVERLRALGYPVHATSGTAGGYRLGAGARLPPLLLDDEEAVAVALCLRTGAGGTVEGIEETSVRALAKLEQVLPSRLRHRVQAMQAVTVQPPRPGASVVAQQVLTALGAACRDHERLRFDYRDHGGTTTRRTVEPYRLVHHGRRWYLLAYDTERDDWRTFRVDRIAPMSPTGPRFTPRELPEDAAAYVAKGVTSRAYRYQARLVLHAPAEVVTRFAWSGFGMLTALDENTCELRTGFETLDSLAMYVGMVGVEFEVREPPELAAHLRAVAARLTRAADAAG